MFGIDVITSYLLVVAISTLLLAVLVWQTHRSGRTVIVWLASSVLGVVLGSIGSFAAMRTMGYVTAPEPPKISDSAAASGPVGMPSMGGMGMGMGGMSKGGGPGMGGMSKGGGPGMGGMGMGGGGRGPQPKRELTTLVRKLEILTGDITITLTADQAAAVNECLNGVEKPAKMSDDEAKAKHDKLLALFNEDQKARFEAIGLPRPTGRPGGAGAPGGPGGAPGMGGGMGMPGGMSGMMGGPKQDEDQNPFQQEAETKTLKSVRERMASKASAAKPAGKPAEKPAAPAVEKPAAAPPPPAAKSQDKPAAKEAEKTPAKKP